MGYSTGGQDNRKADNKFCNYYELDEGLAIVRHGIYKIPKGLSLLISVKIKFKQFQGRLSVGQLTLKICVVYDLHPTQFPVYVLFLLACVFPVPIIRQCLENQSTDMDSGGVTRSPPEKKPSVNYKTEITKTRQRHPC
ncbi:hypothetical protein ACRRTK_014754 [Alexandromys fortis]